MNRYIDYEIVKVTKKGKVKIRITEQSHRGGDFMPGNNEFVASNKLQLKSVNYPDYARFGCVKFCFLRGNNSSADNDIITFPGNNAFKLFVEAVQEYNQIDNPKMPYKLGDVFFDSLLRKFITLDKIIENKNLMFGDTKYIAVIDGRFKSYVPSTEFEKRFYQVDLSDFIVKSKETKNRRHIEYAIVDVSESGNVQIQITEQNHRGDDFVPSNTRKFVASNKLILASYNYPEYYTCDHIELPMICMRGTLKAYDNDILIIPLHIFKLFKVAVSEYNQKFG